MNSVDSGKKAGYESIRLSVMKWLLLPLIIYAAYLICGIVSHTFSDALIPNEYREGANVFMTMELLKGNNPYSLDALKGEVPPMIYLYGPLYSIVTGALGGLLSLLGVSTDLVLLHYGVTFFCIIFSAFIAFLMVREKTGSGTLSLAAFVFLINCSWRYNYVNAVPDSMGLAVMMLILYVVSRKEFKGQEFICAVLTVAVFFTKQYYLLVAGTVTVFLFLFKGIKSTVKYLLSFGLIFGATAFLLNLYCPLFTTYMLYFAKGPGSGVASKVTRGAVKMTGTQYNIQQIMSLGGIFFMFFLTELLTCIFFLVRFIKAFSRMVKSGAGKGKGLAGTFENAMKKAGIDRTDVLMLIHLAVSGICLTYLGRNDGAYLSYYLELFMPALIIGALLLFHRVFMMAERGNILPGKRRIAASLLIIYFILLVGFTAYRSAVRLPVSPLSEKDYKEWDTAEKILDENPGDMYLYPLLSYYGIRHDIYVYNTGQPFVVSEKFYKSYHKHPDKMERYPYAENIFQSHFDFREKILEKVRSGDYSVVSYIEGTDEIFDREDLQIKYEKQGTYELRTGRQVWSTELWIRK